MYMHAVKMMLMIWLCAISIDGIDITEGPQSLYNASLGGKVDFKCVASGTEEPPIWNINGNDYRVTDLPLYYKYFPGSLEVFPIICSMNASYYYCYYLDYSAGQFIKVKSNTSFLFIAQPAETVTPPVVLKSVSSVPCSSLYPSTPQNQSNGVIIVVPVATFLTLMIAGCLLML